jgi:MtrB/PioB family decaheme-associated outer membrane protein
MRTSSLPTAAACLAARLAVCLAACLAVCLALCLAPTPALAQEPAAAAVAVDSGQIDVGLRLSGFSGDRARAQRLRDLRSGPTLDRLRFTRDRQSWLFDAQIDRAGYRDQRYAAKFERFGTVAVAFEWNQVPLFYNDESRSPFTVESPGVFRLDDSIQSAVQGRTATIAGYDSRIALFDTRSRRDTAAVRLDYDITRDLDLRFAVKSTRRNGEQPWGASFGFSNAIELPAPIDQRTNDISTAVEWSNRRGMARLAYDGSWFNNAVETLTWDNPLRFTDQTHASAYSAGDGSSQGRQALWPDSTAHTVSASGSLALPARSRAFAAMSVGHWLQDQRLLPHTINSAITPIPLARDSAEAEARITSLAFRMTSRPAQYLWLSGQYRLYDYDNQTPHFPLTQYVRLDGNVGTSITGGSEPFSYTRHFVDLDASYTAWRHAAVRAGYAQERDDRTFRLFEETTDRTVRASIDTTGLAWGSVRLQYDRSVRTGDGLDEQVLSDIGEQVSLRQFDISDRTRDRVSAIVQLMPLDVLGVSASASIGRENRPAAAFGLQDNNLRAFTVGVDFAPGDAAAATLTYGFERYATRQRSRQANPGVQFNDPTRDWWTDLDENVHTLGLQFDVPRLFDRTTLTAGYDYVGSRATYVYELAPNSTLVTPQQLTLVRNTLHTASAEVRYTLTRQLAVGAGYRFNGYDVEDFALSPGTLNSALIPTYVNLLQQWRPYDAHTGALRLFYTW